MNFEEKRCPHCGALLVENASFCPYCESVLIEKRPAEMPKPKRRRRITAALLLTAVLLVTLTAVDLPTEERSSTRRARSLPTKRTGRHSIWR